MSASLHLILQMRNATVALRHLTELKSMASHIQLAFVRGAGAAATGRERPMANSCKTLDALQKQDLVLQGTKNALCHAILQDERDSSSRLSRPVYRL